MQKRILIYLYDEKASWLVIDDAEKVQQTVLHGNLADLSLLATGYEIQVIVPGQSILLTAAPLPKLNPQRLKQALPFALEEQLIDDINTLHFAAGDYQPDDSFPVAVVAKEMMDAWLAQLEKANIVPHVFIPATLALPFTHENTYICIDANIAMVRTGKYSGFACDRENLATLLNLQLANPDQQIDFVHIYNFTDTPCDFQIENATLQETSYNPDEFLKHLAQWTETYPYINLLQTDYQVSKKATATKKIWLAAAGVALTALIFSLVSNIGSYFILHQATSSSEQQIDAIYKRNFPQASTVVAPRQRMEEKLKKLSSTTNKNNFLSTLAVVGNSLPKATGIQLLSMDYRGNQLTLSVTAASFDNLDAFTQALSHQHLMVKQQNASMAGTTVKANLLITQGVS